MSSWLLQLRAAAEDDLLIALERPEGALGTSSQELMFLSAMGLRCVRLSYIRRVVRTGGVIIISGDEGELLCADLKIPNDQLQPFFQTVKVLAKQARALESIDARTQTSAVREPIAAGATRGALDTSGHHLTPSRSQTSSSLTPTHPITKTSTQSDEFLPSDPNASAIFWPSSNFDGGLTDQDSRNRSDTACLNSQEPDTASLNSQEHGQDNKTTQSKPGTGRDADELIDDSPLSQLKNSPRGRQKQTLLQGTIWMLLAYGVRLVSQGVAFVFLIRALGSEQFGAFMAAFALATLLAPIAEMGGYSLAVRDATANKSMPVTVGRSIATIALCFPICLLAMALIKPLLLAKVSWSVVLCVVFAICLFGSLNRVALGVHVGQRMLNRNAVLESMNGLLQLVWVGVLFLIGPSVETWTLLWLGHYVLLAVVSLAWVSKTWGKPRLVVNGIWEQIRTGSHFALGDVSRYGTAESDKMLLAHFSTLNATGTYSAAQRLIVVAFFPLQAFLGAAYSRFFEAGSIGISSTRALVSRFLPLVAGYGVFMWVLMYFSANFLASLLGHEYNDTATALRLVSPLMLIQGCQYLMADSLSGGGFPNVRSAMQLTALVSGILINLVLVPMLGWRGAALTNLIVQSLLTCGLFIFIFTDTKKGIYRKAQ